MSILNELHLVTAKRTSRISEVEKRRLKLSDRLNDQIECVNAKLNNKFFTKSKQVWRSNEQGNEELVTVSRVIKPWWWSDVKGQVYFPVKYGSQALELVKGKSVIQVENLSELFKKLESLRNAVLNGELDSQLTHVINQSSVRFKKNEDMIDRILD